MSPLPLGSWGGFPPKLQCIQLSVLPATRAASEMMSQCGVVHIIVLPQKTRQPLSNLTKGIVKVGHGLGNTRPKESNLVESHIGYPESFFFPPKKDFISRYAGLCLPSSLVGCLKESELKYKRHLEASLVLKELNVSSMRKNTEDTIHLYLLEG